jgi:hypothetical protein
MDAPVADLISAQSWVAFLLVPFLWRDKEKVLAVGQPPTSRFSQSPERAIPLKPCDAETQKCRERTRTCIATGQ